MNIRSATEADAGRLLEIYGWYVKNTAISFEYDVPSIEDFTGRIRHTLEKYPYLVLEDDGTVQGYAYAGPFGERAAYCRSCELSIYVDRAARGRGYGRALYEAIEAALREMGIANLYAKIASPIHEDDPYLNDDSERFHSRLGYAVAGIFHRCGWKFGRWYNLICMEKMIDHEREHI